MAGLPGMTVDEPMQPATALDGCEGAIDFADGRHLERNEIWLKRQGIHKCQFF